MSIMGISIKLQMSRQAIGDGCLFLSCCRHYWPIGALTMSLTLEYSPISRFWTQECKYLIIKLSTNLILLWTHLVTCGVISPRPHITLRAHTDCAPHTECPTCEHLNVLWWDKREKVTVRRIFYNVNKSHQGQILCRYFLPHVGTERQVLNVMPREGGYWPGAVQESS